MKHKVICSWCRILIRDGIEPISHGICPSCKREMQSKIPERLGDDSEVRAIEEETKHELLTEQVNETLKEKENDDGSLPLRDSSTDH